VYSLIKAQIKNVTNITDDIRQLSKKRKTKTFKKCLFLWYFLVLPICGQ